MLIKVCGLIDEENIRAVANLELDFCGFIFYPRSPRFIANRLANLNFLKTRISKTGVFVNENKTKIEAYIANYNLDALQFHGNETYSELSYFRPQIKTLIKAFSIDENFDFRKIEDYIPICDYFLFDTKSTDYGGSGRKFNWEILQNYKAKIPFLLSGGITVGDEKSIMDFKHPQFAGIDLNSGFESQIGIKNVDLLKKFILKIKSNEISS